MMRLMALVFATLLLTNTTLLASGPTFVQVKSATPQTASGSVAVTYTLAQKAGNLNVVVVGWNDTTSTVSMVSDSLGNNYVLAIGPTTGTGLRQSIYYAAGIKAGSNTVTVRFNQAAAYVDIRALEYSGLDLATPLDVRAGAAGSGTTASSGAATTTSANDLIFGAGMTIAHFTGAGTGFVSRIITVPDADIAEDRTVSTPGSYSATAPNSSGSWVMQMVAFRASGTGGQGSSPAPTVSAISPNTGTVNGGTAVTVTGTGFLSGAAVTIGGAAATGVTVVSSTSITAKTPAHAAGAADVVVKNTDNQTGALSGGYTYTSGTGGGSAAPAGATFYDDFSKGSLDTSKWIPSNWGAPGGGKFVPSYLDFSTGMLRIKLTQTYSGGGVASVGGELQSKNALGFGTYEWVMRASSTSSTPNGSGYTVSGQISSGFIYVNNSQTEIDSPEIEGQNPGTLWWTSWISVNTKQYTSTQAPFAPESGFHSYKCVWTRTSIKFYVDGVLVSTHTGVVPQTPAYAMINHWGTNSTGWGGLATPNITRYMFVRSFSFAPLQ
jgi:Glycosyl hydrolases family 16/IPT/TIG domain